MLPRGLLRLGVFLLLGYLTLAFMAGVFVAAGTLHPGRRSLSANDEMKAQGMAHNHDSELTDVAIQTSDGAPLSAWSIRPRRSNGKAVILLHGLSDNRIGMVGYAELLLRHGFSVLMPDARAHGASGGQLATYGLLESEDIHRWFLWLQQNQHPVWKYKLNFEQASPERIVAETKVPVLLIHGRADRNIPIRHSRRIAADNPSLFLWEVPDTDHCGAISTAREEFELHLIRWFDEHSGNDLMRTGTSLDQRYTPKPNGKRDTLHPMQSMACPFYFFLGFRRHQWCASLKGPICPTPAHGSSKYQRVLLVFRRRSIFRGADER